MKRILAWIMVAALCPATVFALGLGKIELKSGLNQPFNARIELLSPTRESLDSLTVSLAGIDAFERAGIQRPFVLSQLNFEVKENEHGADYIHVYSRDPIREPYLDFLVEANWSNGRLYREYTVLLDPPLYDANARRIVSSPAEEGGAAPAPETTAPGSAMHEGAAPAPSTSETAPSPSHYAGGDYGPTVSTDTLWSIAGKTRPDASVSVQQMMLALLKANPDAFANNNVNGLKRGVVLHMPSRDQIDALTQAQALAQVKSQYAMWDQIRGTAAARVQQRPEGTPTSAGSTAPAQKETETGSGKSELRLVSADKNNGQGTGGSSASGDEGAKKLQLAQEQLDSLKQENADLKSRLSQSENIISDLKRLISLKDKDLSALQQQLSGAKKQQAPAAAAAAKPAAKKTAPAPAEPVAGKEVAPAKHAAKTPTTAAPAPGSGGIVGRLKEIVSANLVFVAGGAGAVVIAIGVLIWIKRRKGTVADVTPVEMPEYVGSEDETEIPGGEAEELEQPETEAPPEAEQEPEAAEAEEPQAVAEAEVVAPAETEAPAPAAGEPEEDPLAEVNVFLAYEHFDQAEDFVREAIAREPDNLEFHAKLLEVFYAANDKKKYEEAAKVLHDKVGGEGPHWDMALAMWQEMSPNRALFEEGAAEEEAAPEAAGGAGGMLDLTAEESAGTAAEPEGLDFDLGDTAAPAGSENAEEEEVLDLTAGSEEEGGLDMTAGQAEEEKESLLDVTAAVALEPGEEQASESGAEQGEEDNVLDVTGGTAESGEDILDISSGGNEGLLDVTAHADLEDESLDEDLLDVTAVSGGESEQDLEMESAEEEKPESDALDLDLGSETEADNVIEFEGASGGEAGEEKLGEESQPEDAGLEFDLSMDTEESGSETGAELSLEQDDGDEGPELELDEGALEIEDEEPAVEAPPEEEGATEDQGFDLDLTLDEDAPAEGTEDSTDLDMEGTVEIPKIEIEDTEDEGEEDHTVFVPRTKETTEQSADDEIATKLDLAKAYVELGDKDSAKSILDEVIEDGNDQQKSQAQDMIKQLS